MALADRVRNDLKEAMRAKDAARTSVLRLLLAAFKDEEGNKRQRAIEGVVKARGVELRQIAAADLPAEEPLTEAEEMQVVAREIKRRQDSAEAFAKAGRDDLAAPEQAATAMLQAYLPAQMSPEEARPRVAEIIAELGASSPADMKRVMPVVMERLRGQADGRTLNQLVRELLSR